MIQNGTLTKPHALTSRITGGQSTTYSYDDRGRQIGGGGRAVTYKPFDLPAEILQEGLVTTFSYDAFGTRVRKLRTVPGAPAEQEGVDTIDGLYERRWTDGGPVEHVFYVHGTDGPVAQVVYAEDPAKREKKLYLHKGTSETISPLLSSSFAIRASHDLGRRGLRRSVSQVASFLDRAS